MGDKLQHNIRISEHLEHVLQQLEHVTNFNEEIKETPAHGGRRRKEGKRFSRVLGNA